MGASQSTDRDTTASSGLKTSYYELLGLQRQATEDEIKKAYRRKALELHPDRNYGNEETATKVFAEVQAAYEVLSDPQERAWYDSHETAILRGDDDVGGEDGVPTYENVRATTADDLARMVRKFNSNVEFSDAPSGFFGFLREAFEGLAKEEAIAANWEGTEAPDYPSFGHKDDAYDDVVKRFYAAWSSFSTVKNFAWKDKYRLSEAPDRWYRRRMEQENKKFRQDGVREFNDAVRSLVAFVRKRDPRYVPSTQTEEERQKTLRDAAAAQAARARAANEAKWNQEVPEWTKTRDPEELEESSEEEVEIHIFECVACNKEFKSERQWEAHEKSKKHQKALYALRKKMRKENANLDLDDHTGNGATEDEIKKAYRRKALELHPDRNYGNEETATKVFAEVQAAYEVLSDPQERAWYDSHETAILRGDDDVGGEDGVPTYENVRATTADDLARMVRKFNSNVEFSDAPSGFFGFLREAFEGLAKEEAIAANWEGTEAPDYPSFGHKDDAYDDVVKRFYAAWSSFSTVKNFAWKDKYRLSEAPDRWYRRRMEQENKKFRQDGVREFNDAVRSLVAFVRKRDPRYVPSTQTEEERQKTLRDAAAAQAARARAANEAKWNQEVPEWTKTRDPEELEESSEEEVEIHIFECVACNKEFKSERQWEAHEKSKKHQKALYALRKKMRKENANLDLDDHTGNGVTTPIVDEYEEGESPEVISISNEDTYLDEKDGFDRLESDAEEQDGQSSVEQTKGEAFQEADQLSEHDARSTSESEADDEYASPEKIQARLQNISLNEAPRTANSENDDDDNSHPAATQPKMGKAAQKRAKRAAAAASSQNQEASQTCATCQASFPSKTQLHQHIKDHGHATLKTVGTASSAKGKKKGKR
nr:dnaj like subfamily c member 21 [Quercus suber]